jgi:hypothetical protein
VADLQMRPHTALVCEPTWSTAAQAEQTGRRLLAHCGVDDSRVWSLSMTTPGR